MPRRINKAKHTLVLKKRTNFNLYLCLPEKKCLLGNIKMGISNTLVIKHLPNCLNDSQKEDLLKYFKATEVKCITSKKNKYNLVFAKFESSQVAQNVLHRLHQVNILGSCLSVEFAKNDNLMTTSTEKTPDFSINENKEDLQNEKLYKQFIDKLTSWCSNVDFTQPVPSHLKYQYPPPNMQTLINIVKALAAVPKFYTQVLHLMNKMNLPCPFGRDILPDVDLEIFPPEKTENLESTDEVKKNEEVVESSESEMSSDEEAKNKKETISHQVIQKKKTKIKVPKFFKPAPLKSENPKKTLKTKFEEVFEKVTDEKEPKKIKLSNVISFENQTTKQVDDVTDKTTETTSGFGFIHPSKKPVEEKEPPKDIRSEREEERLEKEEILCISEKELAENRISEKDRSVLPVYKNYAEGAPTCRLYIKNLAKTVTEQDLRYIYNRYLVTGIENEPNMFDIRLMQEGRMKGQAFVTLQKVELAVKALKETNGYILKDKPLVVQFAHSATK